MAKKQNFLELSKATLASSLKKISLWTLFIVLFDLILYIIISFSFLFWRTSINSKMPLIPEPSPSMTIEQLELLNAEAKSYFAFLLFSIFLLVLFLIFVSSIIKAIIWAKTTKTKLSIHFISKFLGLNLIWMGFWAALLIIRQQVSECTPMYCPLTSAYVILIVSFYLSSIVYCVFMKEQHIKSAAKALKIAFSNVSLLGSYALIIILAYLLELLAYHILIRTSLTIGYINLIILVLVLASIAFSRYYMFELVSKSKVL